MAAALPRRFYRDPAEAVAFTQSRDLYRARGCMACRHVRMDTDPPCAQKRRPGKGWCAGFDEA